MKLSCGCDIGSLTTKAVVMNGARITATAIIKSKPKPEDSAAAVMERLFEKARIRKEDIGCIIGTGYGRERIPFADRVVSEVTCHAKGAHWLAPGVRTVIDIGGQDAKAILVDEKGDVIRFVTNDKCAAGTGRFLEVMAKVLGVSLEELGRMSKKARSPVILASTCTVWAQADVIQYINSGVDPSDIGAGINTAMAKRVAILAGAIKPRPQVCITGGVSKNTGVVSTLEKLVGMRFRPIRKADPQLAGAIGAALIGQNGKNQT